MSSIGRSNVAWWMRRSRKRKQSEEQRSLHCIGNQINEQRKPFASHHIYSIIEKHRDGLMPYETIFSILRVSKPKIFFSFHSFLSLLERNESLEIHLSRWEASWPAPRGRSFFLPRIEVDIDLAKLRSLQLCLSVDDRWIVFHDIAVT